MSFFQAIQPEHIISALGLVGVIGVVFAESGLFFGFFLPGDSLLFTAGLFAARGTLDITWLIIGCMCAAIIGDSVGYAFGKRVGPALFSREDSFFFHKRHAERARIFYEKHGPKAIVLARFVPIVRTFAPIVAGIGGMKYKTFITYNVVGGIFWTLLLTLAGYFLGTLFPEIERFLNYIIVIIIIISVIPIVIEYIRERRRKQLTDM